MLERAQSRYGKEEDHLVRAELPSQTPEKSHNAKRKRGRPFVLENEQGGHVGSRHGENHKRHDVEMLVKSEDESNTAALQQTNGVGSDPLRTKKKKRKQGAGARMRNQINAPWNRNGVKLQQESPLTATKRGHAAGTDILAFNNDDQETHKRRSKCKAG